MPWNEVDRMSLRREFAEVAGAEAPNVSEPCPSGKKASGQ